MPLHCGEQRGHLIAERNRHSLLLIRASDHWSVAVLAREGGQDVSDLAEIHFDERECLAHLQHCRRISDVLRRRVPMAVLAEAISAEGVQLPHHTEDRIADTLGVAL